MRCKWTWIVRAALPGVLVCVLLCLSTGAGGASSGKMPPGMRKLMDAPSGEEKLMAMRSLDINFTSEDKAIDLREQMDFVLTPALLVQEAVSDGVILTYPEE